MDLSDTKEKNLATVFQNRAYKKGKTPFISYKEQGEWHWLKWDEVHQIVEELGRGLIALGVQPRDRVCIFADNCPEWAFIDLATLSIGASLVPIYSTSTAEQAEYIIKDSAACLLIIGNEELAKKLSELSRLPDGVRHVVSISSAVQTSLSVKMMNLRDLRELGSERPAKDFYHRLLDVHEEDLATIIYTSGTTGDPKGVMLSHRNILSNCRSMSTVVEITENDLYLSILPLSHAFERTVGLHTMIYIGVKIAYAESISKASQNIQEVRPTFLICVPRILEKIHNKVFDEIAQKSKIVQTLFKKAMQPENKKSGLLYSLKHSFFDKLFYSRIREKLGGRVRFIVSGGAALSPKINEFFKHIGIPVIQGYGSTELSPVATVNRTETNKSHTVGLPIPGVNVKIAEDGEILVGGPNVMMGYFNNPKATKETIDENGYLRTGDVGHIDEDGHLVITDRKKEIIVTSGGKNIAPQPLENELATQAMIEQACIIGDSQKYLTALIVPNFELLEKKAAEAKIDVGNREELVQHPEVQKWLEEVINNVNSTLPSYSTLKNFRLLSDAFSLEKGEITPTLKLRRKVIRDHYSTEIQDLYKE